MAGICVIDLDIGEEFQTLIGRLVAGNYELFPFSVNSFQTLIGRLVAHNIPMVHFILF